MSGIGSRISLRRRQLGWSQEELAGRSGTEQRQISRYENGINEPTADVVGRLAQAMEVSSDWLLGLTENQDRPLRNTDDLSDYEKEVIQTIRKVSDERKGLLKHVIDAFDNHVHSA